MATRTFGASPGVVMAWSAMWTWNADTPARVPAGARISAGKSGRVARSLPNTALALVKRSPVSCIPSPESPAKRMMTRSSRCGVGALVRSAVSDNAVHPRPLLWSRRLLSPTGDCTAGARDLRARRRSGSGQRGLVDALDRGVERGVELVVALLGGEPLGERPGEAGHDTVVAGQALVRLLAAVAAGEGDHLQDLRVLDELLVEVVLLREGELEHDHLAVAGRLELAEDPGLEERLRLGLLRALDVDLGLDDRDEARREDLAADLELLVHDGVDAGLVGQLDDRAHLRAEHALGLGPGEEVVEVR